MSLVLPVSLPTARSLSVAEGICRLLGSTAHRLSKNPYKRQHIGGRVVRILTIYGQPLHLVRQCKLLSTTTFLYLDRDGATLYAGNRSEQPHQRRLGKDFMANPASRHCRPLLTSSRHSAVQLRLNYCGMVAPVVLFISSLSSSGLGLPFQNTARSFQAVQPIQLAMLDLAALEQDMVAEINRVRTNPGAYADWLETQRQFYEGTILRLPGEAALQTNEGTQALDEAVQVLRAMSPVPPLAYSPGIAQGARDHVSALGSQGLGGTIDQAGNHLGRRINQYGKWRGSMVAIPSYEKRSAQAIVFHQIVSDRSVRQVLLDPAYQFLGIACGDHIQREMMCLAGLVHQYAEQDGSVAVTPIGLPKPAPNKPEPAKQPIITNASASVTNPAEEVSTAIGPKPSNSESPPSQPLESKGRSVIAKLTDQELRALEQDIMTETNRLRANPSTYADELEELKRYYKGKKLRLPNWTFQVETVEGITAVDEAIQDLRQALFLESLTYSQGMSAGARDHLQDLIRNNLTGHIGSNGDQPLQRVQRYGQVTSHMGENISYSPLNTARYHLSQLLIDDDVPNRGHRKALLTPDYRVVGVACGFHQSLGHTCVMTYADGYKEGK